MLCQQSPKEIPVLIVLCGQRSKKVVILPVLVINRAFYPLAFEYGYWVHARELQSAMPQ